MMIALSLFLIYGAVQKVVYTGVDIGAAVVSTMITVLIPTVVTTIEWKSADTGWRKVAKDVLSEVRSTAALSMPASGISFGNAAGHLFYLSPFLFLRKALPDESKIPSLKPVLRFGRRDF